MSWKRRKSEELVKTKYFSLHVDECETNDGKTVPKYFVVDFPDWVQVVALTPERQLILVDQYRYPGVGQFLEFPGGTTAAHRGEEPIAAAKRELLEETGYSSDDWISLGIHYPNPALQTNRSHTFLALGCKKVAEPSLDPFEELTTKLMAVDEFVKLSRQPGKHHSIMLAALFLALPHLGF